MQRLVCLRTKVRILSPLCIPHSTVGSFPLPKRLQSNTPSSPQKTEQACSLHFSPASFPAFYSSPCLPHHSSFCPSQMIETYYYIHSNQSHPIHHTRVISVSQINFIQMSLSQNHSFFKQYAKSGYAEKMNPQFDGMAKKYYREKKEHEKVHTLKAKLDKEVAFMERMEKKIEKNLEKKQMELRYAKEVSSRFQDDLRRREWINQYHNKELHNNQQKANLIKSQSVQRIKEAQNYLLQHKRSLANFHKVENQRIKEARSLKKAQEWDTNRSRVSEIYQFKKDVKESCNKFYQSRTGSSLKNYQTSIKTFKEYKETDHETIKSLEQRLLQISRLHKEKKEKAEEIAQQLSKVRKQSRLQSSLIRSRIRSRSSLSSISAGSKGSHGLVI